MLQVTLSFPVLYILDRLQSAGFDAFIIGGAVRDVLLKREPVIDWDFTTNATPDQVLQLFEESFYDNNFGTVMVAAKHVLAQANQVHLDFELYDVFDITTYRNESGYSNKRHPDKVEWGQSLEEDISRRDFTINALAFAIDDAHTALTTIDARGLAEVNVTIHDYHQGLADLDQGLIRTVGQPEARFNEDALRMLRAVRFASNLDFEIEPDTLKAIKKLSTHLREISGERIRDELFKILGSPRPTQGIELLDETGLLEHILPELVQAKDIRQGGRHQYDVWRHSIESLRECPSSDPLVRLATLLHDVGKPQTMKKQGPRGVTFYNHEVVGAHMCNRIADRLRLSRKQKNRLFTLVRWHMFTYSPEMTDSAIKRFIRRVGLENINDMMNLRIGDRKGGGSKATSWRLRELQQRIGENLYEPMSVRDLKITGHDIMELLEIKPSPVIGQILNQLFELVMDDEIENDPEALKTKAVELGSQLQPLTPPEVG